MNKFFILWLFAVFSVGCSTNSSTAPSTEIDVAAIQTSAVQTVMADASQDMSAIQPTSTPRPTSTPKPVPTATTALEVDITNAIARNYIVRHEENGVIFEVVRILIAKKEAIPEDFDQFSIYQDKPTLVMFVFKIENNTDQVIKGFLGQSIIASVNGEQIPFVDYWTNNLTWFGDNLDNNILPGAKLVGGVWTGIKRSEWNDVNSIVISVPELFNVNTYQDVTNAFLLNIDVTDWTFDPLLEQFE
jgi:hypothetical protein